MQKTDIISIQDIWSGKIRPEYLIGAPAIGDSDIESLWARANEADAVPQGTIRSISPSLDVSGFAIGDSSYPYVFIMFGKGRPIRLKSLYLKAYDELRSELRERLLKRGRKDFSEEELRELLFKNALLGELRDAAIKEINQVVFKRLRKSPVSRIPVNSHLFSSYVSALRVNGYPVRIHRNGKANVFAELGSCFSIGAEELGIRNSDNTIDWGKFELATLPKPSEFADSFRRFYSEREKAIKQMEGIRDSVQSLNAYGFSSHGKATIEI